jgi:hypothetical protein
LAYALCFAKLKEDYRKARPLEYADSSEQASIFAEKALEEMRAGGLTQHPNNYTLWYTFVSEAIPDLTLAITSLDKKQEPVSEHHCAELHQKFFPRPGKKPPLSTRLKIIQSNDNGTRRYHRSR